MAAPRPVGSRQKLGWGLNLFLAVLIFFVCQIHKVIIVFLMALRGKMESNSLHSLHRICNFIWFRDKYIKLSLLSPNRVRLGWGLKLEWNPIWVFNNALPPRCWCCSRCNQRNIKLFKYQSTICIESLSDVDVRKGFTSSEICAPCFYRNRNCFFFICVINSNLSTNNSERPWWSFD